jgi:hypothetical protein
LCYFFLFSCGLVPIFVPFFFFLVFTWELLVGINRTYRG